MMDRKLPALDVHGASPCELPGNPSQCEGAESC